MFGVDNWAFVSTATNGTNALDDHVKKLQTPNIAVEKPDIWLHMHLHPSFHFPTSSARTGRTCTSIIIPNLKPQDKPISPRHFRKFRPIVLGRDSVSLFHRWLFAVDSNTSVCPVSISEDDHQWCVHSPSVSKTPSASVIVLRGTMGADRIVLVASRKLRGDLLYRTTKCRNASVRAF